MGQYQIISILSVLYLEILNLLKSDPSLDLRQDDKEPCHQPSEEEIQMESETGKRCPSLERWDHGATTRSLVYLNLLAMGLSAQFLRHLFWDIPEVSLGGDSGHIMLHSRIPEAWK